MMKNCKETLLGGGRKLVSLMLCALTATACTDTLDEAALPKPLSVDVNARDITARAPIHGTALPDASSIGISLLAEDGTSYDGVTYANLKYTASGTAPDQTWSTPNIPTLSSTSAKLVAYYPWADGTDYTAVPVETDSQTDYMYSKWLTGLSNANPNASIVMQHALTAVRVALVKGDFTADVDVSSVSVKSPAFATAGSLDATTGALSGLVGTGEAVTVTADFPLTAQATNVEVMAVPDVSVAAGVTTVTTQIGGRKYSVNINFTESYKQGYIYTYTLTLNNTGMEVTSVAVTPWQEGTTENGDLIVEEPDDKYIVEINIEEGFAGITYIHNVYGFVGTIDWGDGTQTTYDEFIGWPSHVYENTGNYIVTAKGKCISLQQGIYRGTTPEQKDVIIDNLSRGLKSRDVYNPFAFIIKLIHIGKDMGITDMYQAFYSQYRIKDIPQGIFDGLTEVTTFDWTFYDTEITDIPEGLFDKCTKVTSFEWTFYNCSKLSNIPDGLFDKCTEVRDFEGAFAWCEKLTSIPEGLFDKSTKATNFNTTFMGTSITTIPEGLFDKCVKVESFGCTFYGCAALTGESPYTIINVNGEDKKVHLYERSLYPEYFTAPTDFGYAFYECTGLADYTNIPASWK